MSCNEDNLQLFATEKQYVDVEKKNSSVTFMMVFMTSMLSFC